MMASRFIPGRGWSGNSPHRGGRQTFGTRVEGHQMSRKVWICNHCRAWNDPVEGKKPEACIGCGGPAKAFSHCDSSLEAQRFVRLWMLQNHGEIRGLRHHPRFDLVVPDPTGALESIGVYVADFEYKRLLEHRSEWVWIVEDTKPENEDAQDPLFKWKRKHFERQYGTAIRIVSKT